MVLELLREKLIPFVIHTSMLLCASNTILSMDRHHVDEASMIADGYFNLPDGEVRPFVLQGEDVYLLRNKYLFCAHSRRFSLISNLRTGEGCARFFVEPESITSSILAELPQGVADVFFVRKPGSPAPADIWATTLAEETRQQLTTEVLDVLVLLVMQSTALEPRGEDEDDNLLLAQLGTSPDFQTTLVGGSSHLLILDPFMRSSKNIVWRRKTSTGTWHAELLDYKPGSMSLTLATPAGFPVGEDGSPMRFSRPRIRCMFGKGHGQYTWFVCEQGSPETTKPYANPPKTIAVLAPLIKELKL